MLILLNYLYLHLCQSISSLLDNTRSLFFSKDLTEEQLKYVEHNLSYMKSVSYDPQGIVLMDSFAVPQWLFPNSILANELAHKYNLSICTYGSRNRSIPNDSIYRSFGCREHLKVSLNQYQLSRHLKLFYRTAKNLKSPADPFNLNINGIHAGIDIYESILRKGNKTVSIRDPDTYKVLFNALKYYIYFKDLFATNLVKSVILSHDCYYQMGLVMRIAHAHSVPVYFATIFDICRSTTSHDLYDKFQKYPQYSRKISPSILNKLKIKSKLALNKRLNGSVGIHMHWQTKSAYQEIDLPNQLRRNSKIKVLVLTHCFFDNPHAYKVLPFKDFYEWMIFLGQLSKTVDYDWYIKPHRDYLPGTLKILNDFVSEFPNFKLINPECSFHQLKDEGLDFALTCYGSAGHELPLLGINVINASYGPHAAYDFNINPKNLSEYRSILLNLSDYLDSCEQTDIDKVYKFFAMHNLVSRSDCLLFESNQEFITFIGNDPLSDKAYAFYNLDAVGNHRRYSEVVKRYLDSGLKYQFELQFID